MKLSPSIDIVGNPGRVGAIQEYADLGARDDIAFDNEADLSTMPPLSSTAFTTADPMARNSITGVAGHDVESATLHSEKVRVLA
jgi:hypothetical protein